MSVGASNVKQEISVWALRSLFYSLASSVLLLLILHQFWYDSEILLNALLTNLVLNMTILGFLSLIRYWVDWAVNRLSIPKFLLTVIGGCTYSFGLSVLTTMSYFYGWETGRLIWFYYCVALFLIYYWTNQRFEPCLLARLESLDANVRSRIPSRLKLKLPDADYWESTSYAMMLLLIISTLMVFAYGLNPIERINPYPWFLNFDLYYSWWDFNADTIRINLVGSSYDLVIRVMVWPSGEHITEMGISVLGLILPLFLSITLLVKYRAVLWEYKFTIIIFQIITLIFFSSTLLWTSIHVYGTIWAFVTIAIFELPVIVILQQKGRENATIVIASLILFMSSIAVLFVSLQNIQPYFFMVIDGYGLAAFSWRAAAFTVVFSIIVGLYLAPEISDKHMLSSIFRIDLHLFAAYSWTGRCSRPTKTLLAASVLTFLLLASNPPSLSLPQTFEEVSGDWESNSVHSIASWGPGLLVSTSSGLYYVSPFSVGSFLVSNLTTNGQSIMSRDISEYPRSTFPSLANYPNSSIYIAGYGEGSLYSVAADGLITRITSDTILENCTLNAVLKVYATGALYVGGGLTGLYAIDNNGIPQKVLGNADLDDRTIFCLKLFREKIFIGTDMGFEVYNPANEEWFLISAPETVMNGFVFDFEHHPSEARFYVASTNGLQFFNTNQYNVTYEESLSPHHGLASVYTTCVEFDETIGSLIVGTTESLCSVDIDSRESVIISDTEGVRVGGILDVTSFWRGNIYSTYILSGSGNLFKLTIDYGFFNSMVWGLLLLIGNNTASIALAAAVAVITTLATEKLKKKSLEKKQGEDIK